MLLGLAKTLFSKKKSSGEPSFFMYSTGDGTYYQHGLEVSTDITTIQKVGSDKWKNISPAQLLTLAIKSDGTLWGVGYKEAGIIGDTGFDAYQEFVQVGSSSDWKQVETSLDSSTHALAIKTDGTLWVWGNNNNGQLGLGDTTARNDPVQLGSDTWSDVAAGDGWSAGIKTNGTLWAWGYNNYGVLGQGNTTNYNTPQQIGSGTDWQYVSGGRRTLHAIKTDGTLWGCGYNAFSVAHGDGSSTTTESSLAQIGSDTDWKSTRIDLYHVGGLKTDGTLLTWGFNNVGQLAQGDTTNRLTPTVVGSDKWKAFKVGGFYSCGIKENGTFWSVGTNSNGELGLGDTSSRTSLTQVGSDTDWVDVFTGANNTFALKET